MSKALQLKEEGNKKFQAGDYASADSLYSKAIIADSKNPALYTNRAMARIRLGYWDAAISDCTTCLSLAPKSMKAHYYLSQAALQLRDLEAAVTHALQAHELCVATGDKSLSAVTAMVLKCKKERWDEAEKVRRREEADLEDEVLALLGREREAALAEAASELEQSDIVGESERKAQRIRDIFERGRVEADKRREVPDWAIDDISFGIMVDPVITKTGKSYERASITEHLNRHPIDPLTREPLTTADLRPNYGLKLACEEFLDKNGWAVDW